MWELLELCTEELFTTDPVELLEAYALLELELADATDADGELTG